MWKNTNSSSKRNSIFSPVGQIGLVCDGKSVSLCTLGDISFITVSNSRQFAVYESTSLRLVFISLPLLSDIRALTTSFENTYVVISDNSIHSFHKYEHRSIDTCHSYDIISLFVAWDRLVTYSMHEVATYTKDDSNDGNTALNWTIDRLMKFDDVEISIVMPLLGFTNKILLGLTNGHLYLYNIKSSTIVYKFEYKGDDYANATKNNSNAVCIMAQSRHILSGAVAIGYKSGYVAVIDIKSNEMLGGFQLTKQQREPCSMLFVYDKLGLLSQSNSSLDSKEILIIGAYNGDIILFNLAEFTVYYCLESFYNTPVRHLLYIEKQNHIVTCGEDNSITLWATDSSETFIRELTSRHGIIGHVNIIDSYDADELDMLVCSFSGGIGSLSKISTIQQHQCTKFTLKSIKHKIPKITGIASSYQRHYDWPNIITCHLNTHHVHVWSGHRRAIISNVLKVQDSKIVATSVCVTKCGNYAIVGYENGEIHSFTLQSCNYDTELLCKNDRGEKTSAHVSKVINISVIEGTKIQSICDSKEDPTIKMWSILDMTIDSCYDPDIPHGSYIYLAKCNNLLTAIACSDGNVYICDVVGKQTVRKLTYGIIVTAMSFHPNGTWFIASGSDSTMIVYDILTSCYVDYVKFSGIITNLNIDNSGTFLSIASNDSPGMVVRYYNKYAIQLYSKTTLYKDIPKEPILLKNDTRRVVTTENLTHTINVNTNVDIQPEVSPAVSSSNYLSLKSKATPRDRGEVSETINRSRGEVKIDDTTETEEDIEMSSDDGEEEVQYSSKTDQLDEGLITLSGLSSARLQSILYLDEIKERSRPVEPDGQLVFAEPVEDTELKRPTKEVEATTKVIKMSKTTDFEELMKSNLPHETKYEKMLELLMSQTPSAVHMSITLLGNEDRGESLLTMLKFFEYHILKKANYDAVQVFLHIFLKLHGEVLIKLKRDDVLGIMNTISSQLRNDESLLQDKFDRISCFIKFISHLQID